MADVLGFIPPLARYFNLTTDYGDPVAAGPSAGSPHLALDFGAPYGEPVFSMAPGTVLAPNANPEGVTGGNTITIQYPDGVIATFAHLSNIFVKPGDKVGRGQLIGTVGNSGITTGTGGTSGSHLHLDTWKNGIKINPLDLFDWTAESIDPKLYSKAPGILPEGAFDFIGGVGDAIGGAVGGVVDMGTAVAKFVEAVTNPATWARVAAMLLGFVMTLVGAYMIWSAT